MDWSLKNPQILFWFCIVVSVLAVGIYIGGIVGLYYEQVTPAIPKGWGKTDYDAAQGARESLNTYMASKNISADTPMNQFTVATANFGGIFTEDMTYSPWIGHVNPDAARLQVEAGARAMVLDIWPNPANRQKAIVAAMRDVTQWQMQQNWIHMGLNRGVGRYSNWNRLTRNTAPVETILKAALTAAFRSVPGKQNTDPFFLLLRLHGAMTTEYLNTLGAIVYDAIGPNAMGSEWNKCQNQGRICSAPVSDFFSKVFLIVLPDIQSGYNSLPNINTHSAFTNAFLKTKLGEITNAVEQIPNTMAFEPSSSAAITVANQPACKAGSPQQTLAQTGFCLIQPTIGGSTADNTKLFTPSYPKCLQTGAHFVAVNYFSPNSGDAVLSSTLFNDYFGKYSFHKN
jgi:hypothetical protein